jgi:hypothetical protein
MYQKVGKFLSEKSKEASYGDNYIDALAAYISEQFPGIKGFNRRGLYRMKQFYETYAGNEHRAGTYGVPATSRDIMNVIIIAR